MKAVASHIQPLEGRHVQHSQRDRSEVVHTQIEVGEFQQFAELKKRVGNT